MKSMIKRGLRGLGYEVNRISNNTTSNGYDQEQEATRAIDIVRSHTMVSFEPLITLFQQVRHCEKNDIHGSYVECGVWKGGACGLMALANLQYGENRRDIHLFDAFQEICEPDANIDGEKAIREVNSLTGVSGEELKGSLRPLKGIYDNHGGPGSIEIVKSLLEETIGYPPESLNYHQGWFQETLPEVIDDIGDIAILRLDGDWYASTKVCLAYLYDKVIPGGFVIVDDYGCYEGCSKAVDEFLVKRGLKVFLNHVNVDCRYWIKHG